MSISSQQILWDKTLVDGRRHLLYEFTDNLILNHQRGPKTVPSLFDSSQDLLNTVPVVESDLVASELAEQLLVARNLQNPDKVPPDYQTQSDFDRRLLGLLMLEYDIYVILNSFPFYDAVSARGGNNAGQRAAYLGVPTAEWTEVLTRFQAVKDREFFLTDQNGYLWDEYPSDIWGQ